MTALNRHKYWKCPFFKWDGKQELSCEAGRPQFPDKKTANDYLTCHCAGNWKDCSLAKAMLKYYEEAEHDHHP